MTNTPTPPTSQNKALEALDRLSREGYVYTYKGGYEPKKDVATIRTALMGVSPQVERVTVTVDDVVKRLKRKHRINDASAFIMFARQTLEYVRDNNLIITDNGEGENA